MPDHHVTPHSPTEHVRASFQGPGWREAWPELRDRLEAGSGRNAIGFGFWPRADGGTVGVAVKSFGGEPWLKNLADRRRGTKARRSFETAVRLLEAGVGTPEPVGWFETWGPGGRLQASHYVSVRAPRHVSLRDELIRVFRETPDVAVLLPLLQQTADLARTMHAAGVVHRDLGNQNILLCTDAAGRATGPAMVVDLNRARWVGSPSLRQRARDLSRLHLSSDLLRILYEMYFEARAPRAFLRWEKLYRQAFAVHTRTRAVRHPLRTFRASRGGDPGSARIPSDHDLWLWDEKSAQAISCHQRPERKRLHSPSAAFGTLGATLAALPGVASRYRVLMDQAFGHPVDMDGRIGVALTARPDTLDRERDLLQPLGSVPVLLRFYHHEDEAAWQFGLEAFHRLRSDGHPVAAALVQDRRAVLDPARWRRFVDFVLEGGLGEGACEVEIGHAVNRVKWGLWTPGEYAALAQPVLARRADFPALRLLGPAAIDFEYHRMLGFLAAVPRAAPLDALSLHLYVDRRGAPENRQNGFDLAGKCALARAIAEGSPRIRAGRVVITEANWPLLGTAEWSPVGSPYLFPGQHVVGPSVDEATYADYMVRYLLLALCSGLVERVYWWRLVAQGFGLVDDTDPAAWRPRPAYHALVDLISRAGKATFQSRTVRPDAVTYRFTQPDGAETTFDTRSPTGSSPRRSSTSKSRCGI